MANRPIFVTEAEVARAVTPDEMLSVIGEAFSDQIAAGTRAVAELAIGTETLTTLAMPALDRDGVAVVKIVSVSRGDRNRLNSQLAVIDAFGQPIAILEAHALTALRTAAASVHAAQALGVSGGHLLVLGSGRQAEAQARAYISAMPIERLTIWARREEAAADMAKRLRDLNCAVDTAQSRKLAIGDADIMSSATASREPIVSGMHVKAGAHVDLVGSFRPDMREGDDALMQRAQVFADTSDALNETGDLIDPIASGTLERSQVRLISEMVLGGFERGEETVTVFKSVGHAALDSVAARLACRKLGIELEGIAP